MRPNLRKNDVGKTVRGHCTKFLALLAFGFGLAGAAAGLAATPMKMLPATLPLTLAASPPHTLAQLSGKHATVLVFMGADCPITNSYAHQIAALSQRYSGRGVTFLRVYSGPAASAAVATTHGQRYGLTALPAIVDADDRVADALGALVTPEVFVLDATRMVRYSGRIDDRYVDRGKARTNGASTHELVDALNAVLAGKTITADQTRAIGCAIERPKSEVALAPGTPTYAHDVAAVLQQNCVSCHRAGEIGPMPLETYEQARQMAANIASVTASKQMPPWKPDPTSGPFLNERHLSDTQIALLKSWSAAGAPAGDLKSAPVEPNFPKGWTLGTPDLVLKVPAVWHTAADSPEVYRCFALPTGLTEDKEVVAVEYRPGNRSVVHHILGFVDTGGRARAMEGKDGLPGYTSFGGPGFMPNGEVGGWAPGNMPQFLPDGVGRLLPANSDIVLQIHYHPTGKPEDDQSQIGLYFARKPITKHLRTIPILAPLNIPAGEAAYHTSNTFTSPLAANIIAVTPHMHLLGRQIAMAVKYPDGSDQSLIKINDWDFNWQGTYTYQKAIHIPKGAVITLDATYDNSTANPRNPHSPPQHVGWGEATTDEMCIGFISYVADDENDPSLKFFDAILGGARKKSAALLKPQ